MTRKSPRFREGHYEVGYGKPPKTHCFRPGECGNPTGRPRKSQSGRSILQEVLNASLSITEKGVQKQITHQKAVFKMLVACALKGNVRCMSLVFQLMDRYGMMMGAADELHKMVIEFVKPQEQPE
jgi:hypothetical protein